MRYCLACDVAGLLSKKKRRVEETDASFCIEDHSTHKCSVTLKLRRSLYVGLK